MYTGFTKEMEIFGMLSIVCEFKVLTLLMDPFLDQGIQFVAFTWSSGQRYFPKQNCLQFVICTLWTAGSSPAFIEIAGYEELLLFTIYQEHYRFFDPYVHTLLYDLQDALKLKQTYHSEFLVLVACVKSNSVTRKEPF